MERETSRDWKLRIEREIARDNARERTQQSLQRLQKAARATRENPEDSQNFEELKKCVISSRGFCKTDVNMKFADNLYLLMEELQRIEREFGLTKEN